MSRPKRQVGRPPKAPEQRKSSNLTIRMRQEFRDDVQRRADANRRSISEEIEARLTASFADDKIGDGELADLYELTRRYLRALAARGQMEGVALKDSEVARAMSIGLGLIIDAARTTPKPLSEERIKRFWTKDVEGLGKATNVAVDAFNVLSGTGLATIDPLKFSEWIRAEKRK